MDSHNQEKTVAAQCIERCSLCNQAIRQGGIKMDAAKAISMDELISIIDRVREAMKGYRCQACGRKL